MHRQRGWTWVLAPKPFDLVSSSLYIGVLFSDLYFSCDCNFTWTHVMLIACTILILLSIDRVEYWFYGEDTPAASAAALLLARVILIEYVAQLDNFDLSPFLYLIPPFLAAQYFGNRAGYLLAALAWMTYLVKLWLRAPDWYIDGRIDNNFIIFTLGLIFAITMARTVIKEKESRVRAEQLLTELEASHQQLKTYSEQLEKALAFRKRDPHEADLAVSDAKHLASEALQDVRSSVGALRATDEKFSFSSAIESLVDRVRGDTLAVEVDIAGKEAGFSKQALITLYRAAQEGLTNVQKHAKASSVRVDIHFMESEANLSLSDNGCGFDLSLLHSRQPGQDGQYGLQGVQERLETVGGHLQVVSHPGKGTQLFVTVPKDMLTGHATLAKTSFSFAQEDR